MTTEDRPPSDPREDLARKRTGMARFRTQLALDRTTLAWVRTTLSMASFGFGMVAFFRTIQEKSPSAEAIRLYQGAIRVGTALLSVGIGGAVLAGVSHWLALRQLASGQPVDANRWSLSVALVILTAIIGLMALWELYAR